MAAVFDANSGNFGWVSRLLLLRGLSKLSCEYFESDELLLCVILVLSCG